MKPKLQLVSALLLVWCSVTACISKPPLSPAQIGVPIEGTGSLRLIGFISLNGWSRVIVSDARLGILQLEQGESDADRMPKPVGLASPIQPEKRTIVCERLDPAAGVCVLNQNSNKLTLRLPIPLQSRDGEACVWLANCPAGIGLELLAEMNRRTVLVPDDLVDLRLPAIVCRKISINNASGKLARLCREQGIEVVPHGQKWMLALRHADKERYLKALPVLPSASSDGHLIRAGMIKFIRMPLAQVIAIYGDLSNGPKHARTNGLPPRHGAISLMLMTDVTVEEARHMLDVLLLLNDFKVVVVSDTEFKVIDLQSVQ